MAVKPENQARSNINSKIPKSIHREKMGTGYSAGTADQWYSGDPHDLWIEYKFLPKPPVRPFTLQLSALQLDWLKRRYEEGRAVGVVLCFPASTGCWVFLHREWEGQIDPKSCMFVTRQQVADFIVQGCTDDATHSAIVRRRKGG